MTRRIGLLATLTCLTIGTGCLVSVPSAEAVITSPARCSAGAHTLSRAGDHVYPETGNGGYRSVHTDVHLAYDAPTNQLLPGNGVVLTDQATQCLTNFSLDLERTSPDTASGIGPDLTVRSVTVNGRPARFTFVQPTYPGDPKGQNDPDPRAHQAGQNAVVGGPQHNPLPPACAPQPAADAAADSADGTACPANKLVITPVRPLARGARFVVAIAYTGRPGVHRDGDGSTEGWFRSDSPVGDGSFVTTEPVGTEDWMPLNDHPSAKPTYDFYDTVNRGRTAVANGILVSTRTNRPSRAFPHGSTTFHWHSAAPIASYLVENSVGSFDLKSRLGSDGIRYYQVQASSISAPQKAANAAIMSQQQDIIAFQSRFNGKYPFRSAGILIGLPSASFEEEMQSMITFEGGVIDLDTLNHENMHQWWGDNVSEANYDMTFYKEGLATLGEYLFAARQAQSAAGGSTGAFESSLRAQFADNYADESLFTGVPSDPTAATLFDGDTTYTRPGTAYLALRQILGATRFDSALQQIQRDYRGSSITEPQLEREFARWLPRRGCTARLSTFFTQWFDTAYPSGRPSVTAADFYDSQGGCG